MQPGALTARPERRSSLYFPVLISVRGRVNPRAIVRLQGLGKLKKLNDPFWNRTRHLPDSGIAPEIRYRAPSDNIHKELIN
jgi:hypothetical protein